MSENNPWLPEYRPTRNPAHEAVLNMIGFSRMLDALSYSYGYNEEYPTEFVEFVESSDEDDIVPKNGAYCGFRPNFLAPPRVLPPLSFKSSRRVTAEEAERNAKKLLDEEEKLKVKAEKKKKKKIRQRERKRQEKIENENLLKSNQAEPDPGKSRSTGKQPQPTEKQKRNENQAQRVNADKKNRAGHKPPDPAPQCPPAASAASSDFGSEDEEDEEEEESFASEPEAKPDPGKSRSTGKQPQPTEKQKRNENQAQRVNADKKNRAGHKPPDPAPQCPPAASAASSDFGSEDEEDEEEEESFASEPEELDMNSCFVSNAAAIARRQMEQKQERKERRARDSRSEQGAQPRSTSVHKTQVNNEKEEPEETANDFINQSVGFAVLGNQHAQLGDLPSAVKYFTDAIRYNPKEYKLFGNRSFCYEKLQQYERALADADIALLMNPSWIKGLYRKGKALVGLKRYCDAVLVYKDVLKLDSSCTDAAHELMRVHIMQLMEMGFSREQSSNALIIHGTIEKALDALSGLQGSVVSDPVHDLGRGEEEWQNLERRSRSQPPPRAAPPPQPRARTLTPTKGHHLELFPIWVGGLVASITETRIYDLFSNAGPVHSVKVLQGKRCAFVNYTRKAHCETAIRDMNGLIVEGVTLQVRYPERIHTHLGVSKTANTDQAVSSMDGKCQPDECYFWRTTGCIKNGRCTFKHIPEHKGIDRAKVQ